MLAVVSTSLLRRLACVLVLGVSLGACASSPRSAPRHYDPPPGLAVAAPGARGHVLAFASAQIGRPYCLGGRGPGCWDCSGLAQAAWRAAGVSVPRTSQAQADKLPRLPLSEVRPGDIVWRPGHVGIYAGGAWVIAATKTGDFVRYQPLKGYQLALRPQGQ